MTLVTGTVQDLGYDALEGVLYARAARFRSDGGVVLAPERIPYKLVGGVVSVQLAPGPAVLELKVGSHARGTFEVVIPDQASITLGDLLDTVFPWEPAQINKFVAERELAQAAKVEAVAAAAVATEAKARAILEHEHVHLDAAHVDAVAAQLPALLEQANVFAQDQVPPFLQDAELKRTYVPMPGLSVNPLTGMVHAVTPSGEDDSAPALTAAADAARAAMSPLYIPPGATLYVDSTVNLRYLDVHCHANIVIRHTDGPGVIAGDIADDRAQREIYFRSVFHAGAGFYDWNLPHPAIRIAGLKSASVNIARCSLLEFWADRSNAVQDGSTAYNNVTLGRITHLRITSVNAGWINENLFFGGSLHYLTIQGDYSHNNNKWIKTAVEGPGARIRMFVGNANLMEDARLEGTTGNPFGGVEFGAGAFGNTVSTLWSPNRDTIGSGVPVVDPSGLNTVTSRTMQDFRRHTVARLDSDSATFDTAGGLAGGDTTAIPVPSVGGGALATRSQWGYMLDVTIPLADPQVSDASANETLYPPSAIRRLLMHSDAKIIRPEITGFDASGAVVDPVTTPFIAEYSALKRDTTNPYYNTTAAVSTVSIQVISPVVKSLRIRARPGVAAGALFRHVTLTAYLPSSHDTGLVRRIADDLARPLFAAAAPTQGLARPGRIVAGLADSWKSVARVDAALSGAAAGTSLTLVSGSGIAVGDVIGVLLDNGKTHWSTVSAIAGTAVTLATAVPSAASTGRAVGTTRWAVL